jgi:hypothetical protein
VEWREEDWRRRATSEDWDEESREAIGGRPARVEPWRRRDARPGGVEEEMRAAAWKEERCVATGMGITRG